VLPATLDLWTFDDLYTAPACGFRDARDYYRRSSSAPLVPRIRVPCRILFAEDDPFIDPTVLDHLELPPNVQVLKTPRGGHLGFLGLPGTRGGGFWMDGVVLGWLEEEEDGA